MNDKQVVAILRNNQKRRVQIFRMLVNKVLNELTTFISHYQFNVDTTEQKVFHKNLSVMKRCVNKNDSVYDYATNREVVVGELQYLLLCYKALNNLMQMVKWIAKDIKETSDRNELSVVYVADQFESFMRMTPEAFYDHTKEQIISESMPSWNNMIRVPPLFMLGMKEISIAGKEYTFLDETSIMHSDLIKAIKRNISFNSDEDKLACIKKEIGIDLTIEELMSYE